MGKTISDKSGLENFLWVWRWLCFGSPFEDLTIAVPLAAETGAEVVIPHYRLAPESPWPAAIDDGFSVFKEMSSEPLALVGESAGGIFASL